MPLSDLAEFQRWLLAERASSPCAIVLCGTAHVPTGLASTLASHLSAYDEDAQGLWQAFSPELIQEISTSPEQRGLLGLTGAAASEASSRHEVLAALARRGFAVLEEGRAPCACESIDAVFRVSLGASERDDAHVCLKPEWFNLGALPVIIGDTYLEWRATGAPDLRKCAQSPASHAARRA